MDELQRALREHGVATYKEAAIAVLEVDGSISVLKYDDIEPTASTHLNRRRFHARADHCINDNLININRHDNHHSVSRIPAIPS